MTKKKFAFDVLRVRRGWISIPNFIWARLYQVDSAQ